MFTEYEIYNRYPPVYEKKHCGLVFSGGGGNGAYEIGVWKAINEMGIFQVDAVSGTSVGALNAALFATLDYEEAEQIWMGIKPEHILTLSDALKYLMEAAAFPMFLKQDLMGFLTAYGVAAREVIALNKTLVSDKVSAKRILESVFRQISSSIGGMFSQKGLGKIIKESGVLSRVEEKEKYNVIPCFVTCVNASDKLRVVFRLDCARGERFTKILLASSAIPFIFTPVVIDGKSYYDGGVGKNGDNVPIEPIYQNGHKNIIVVHLKEISDVERKEIDAKFPGVTITHIVPQKKLYKPNVLNFNHRFIVKTIDQGYQETKQLSFCQRQILRQGL
jgi:NTE family protein